MKTSFALVIALDMHLYQSGRTVWSAYVVMNIHWRVLYLERASAPMITEHVWQNYTVAYSPCEMNKFYDVAEHTDNGQSRQDGPWANTELKASLRQRIASSDTNNATKLNMTVSQTGQIHTRKTYNYLWGGIVRHALTVLGFAGE